MSLGKNPLRVAPPDPEGFLSRTRTKAHARMDSESGRVIIEKACGSSWRTGVLSFCKLNIQKIRVFHVNANEAVLKKYEWKKSKIISVPGADRNCRTIHPVNTWKTIIVTDRSVHRPLNAGSCDSRIANGFEVCFCLAFDPHQIPSSQQFSVFHSLSKIVLDLVFSKCWQPLADVFTTESWWWLTAECWSVPSAGAPGDGVQDGVLVLSRYPPLWRFWVQRLCTFCSLRN